MSLGVRFSSDQMKHVQIACNKAKLEVPIEGNVISVDSESYSPILTACRSWHNKALNTKTKSVSLMERLFNLEHVIKILEANASKFVGTVQVEEYA